MMSVFGTTSIVIPTYNGLPLLQNCLQALRQYTLQEETPYEIIVADNGSSDGTDEWCIQQRIPFIRFPGNLGFPAACNGGLRLASGDHLLLLNNDVNVTRDWLPLLLKALRSAPDIGLVGPVTNYASGRQHAPYPFSGLEEFQRIAAEVNRSDPEKWEPARRIIGFCLLMKREVYEQIGELDERFSPGHYEDDDYCMRAGLSGFGIRICRDVLVHHEGSASFNLKESAMLRELLDRNHNLFMEKWNVDPNWFV